MNYCILGAAKSGLAATRLAYKINSLNSDSQNSISLTELNPEENFVDVIDELKELNVQYDFGGKAQLPENAESFLKKCDALIISPGVPASSVVVQKAISMKIPVISELEFAYRHLKNPIVAVTGTNGKTTTTSLITFILNHSRKKAISAGNIGLPLSEVALRIIENRHRNELNTNSSKSNTNSSKEFSADFFDENTIDENTIIVVEVSSYQLEFIDTFKPNVAIILNITPDHLKYHKTFENYVKAKLKIAKNQTSSDYLILNADDEVLDCKNIAEFQNRTKIKSQIYCFSISPVERGIYIQGENIINSMQQNKEELMQINEIKIPGIHNRYNSMAASIVSKVWQLTNEDIRDSLMQFQGVEHRLEFVKSINGVDFINDSKATNVNATWYALSSYSQPIIWLAGGQGDNNDYSMLDKLVKSNVKKIITFGEEKEAIYSRYSNDVDSTIVDTLNDAVKLASVLAVKRDVVLFSPACKSFDQFLNFEQRGEIFKQSVYMLTLGVN